MKKKLARLIVSGIGLALVIYGAVRSYDFIAMTVPPDKLWWGYAGLAASEFGMLAWLAAFLWDEGSSAQSAISLIMLVVDFIGSIGLSSADMFIVSGERGIVAQIAPDVMSYILLGLAALVALNVGAGLAYHAADPDAAKHRAQREAFGKIEDAALAKIAENAEALAAELSVDIAEDWRAKTAAVYRSRLGSGSAGGLPSPNVVDSVARPVASSNGNHKGEAAGVLRWPKARRGKVQYNSEAGAVRRGPLSG